MELIYACSTIPGFNTRITHILIIIFRLEKLPFPDSILSRSEDKLGRILLNIQVGAGVPLERVGDNNILLVCVANPPIYQVPAARFTQSGLGIFKISLCEK